ncbi:MAG: protein-L-isoaspartate(D-aspartate) O-methyltransferase [Chloroflexi bacterium]|nr:protein-L-isoaspartate(D-aspartate) O-methyltransferase [Chloroflexota bacterium]MBM3173475.1 protein-L-isoaspartate(D-aspartate) O-methyltransferase [Chloroflexota bacterium]MBM3174418.1 protein-L-isoaspartate(D-aspartate) O-methyltransferase [Chloroflexota bacterium]MBM4449400.1 protein-L-isoaspartate(D-aspartate) O-methyltransferase [Chloroflexota bacterium]
MGLELTRARLLEYLSREISDKRVLQAMARVPRELFVLPDYYHSAYEDIPLSIGFGQTISQPFIVALMTQALKIRGNEKVLEVGTGSGYQTAILAELARWVVSVERIPQLAESARAVLEKLGYNNVEIHLAGTTLGWPSEAPYNAILVTAASPRVPDSLLRQLAIGGRLVVPVGSRWEQELYRVTKRKGGNSVDRLGGCRFVPLIGDEAWEE